MTSTEPTVLLTGATGFLGRAMRRRAAGRGQLVLAGRQVPAGADGRSWCVFDVRDAAATQEAIQRQQPDVVLHAAATMEPDLLEEVIVSGTRAVAEGARRADALLVHVSTDMVFDGEKPPYDEESPLSPNTPYGAAKARAEEVVRDGVSLIARTSLLFSAGDDDPRTKSVATRVRGGEDVVFFTDEIRCPALVDDVAEALWLAALDASASRKPRPGVVHLMGPDAMSRWEFGNGLLHHLGLGTAGVRPGTIRESGLVRPRDLTLVARHTPAAWRAPIRSPRALFDRS